MILLPQKILNNFSPLYTRTKEAFGWPEDNEEFADSSAAVTAATAGTTAAAAGMNGNLKGV